MVNKYHMALSALIGGLAIQGAISACGGVSTSVPDAHASDAQISDAQITDAPAASEPSVPPGAIVAFGGVLVPSGWRLCDGSEVSRVTYASLFAVIGINFGSGDGIATFILPDFRGRFLRGADNGAGHDPNALERIASNLGGTTGDAVATLQPDQFASHRHVLTDPGHSHTSPTTTGASGLSEVAVAASQGFDYNGGSPVSTSMTGITEAAAGGSETRPQNVAVNYIIKL